VRRLLSLVCALVLVDTMLYAALTPLLGRFAQQLHLSSATAGVLVAVYAAGALVGRLNDRRGALVPVRWGLLGGAVTSLGLTLAVGPLPYALLVVVASVAYGVLFTPAFALIADGADRARLAQGMAFGVMNAAWALGAMTGPAAGGALAGAVGERTPFILVAIACALLLIGLRSQAA
jgi:MFS family permease